MWAIWFVTNLANAHYNYSYVASFHDCVERSFSVHVIFPSYMSAVEHVVTLHMTY